MAISFSRPDPSSPSAVAAAAFPSSRKGFDQAEVREFLRMVAAELARLQEREKFLESELRTSQRSTPMPAVLDEEIVTRMLGEEAARILTTAREAATQIKVRSEEGAARLLREATDESQRVREAAEVESARRRSDASADAESELEMAKQQGREMVDEARQYRERVLSELARRRELARQQIEQLVHGRDRLLQAFERSRLVAVDVMAELSPLGEPSEYVNLSPTTGPVPVMVPGMARPESPRPNVEDGMPIGVVVVPPERDPQPAAEPDPDATVALAMVVVEDESAGGAELGDEIESDTLDGAAPEASDDDPEPSPTESGDAEPPSTSDDGPAEDAPTARRLDIGPAADAGDHDEDREPAQVVELFGPPTVRPGADAGPDAAGPDDAGPDDAGPDDAGLAEVSVEADPAEVVADDASSDDEPDILDAALLDDASVSADAVDVAEVADVEVDPEAARGSVDDIFARLRASRADEVAMRATAETAPAAEATTALAPPVEVADRGPEPESPAAVASTGPDSVFQVSPAAPAHVAVPGDTPFAERDEQLTSIILGSARKLKRVLADEQNEVLHALRGKEPIVHIDGLLPSPDQHSQRYSSAVEPELLDAAVAGAGSVGVTGAKVKRTIVTANSLEAAIALLTDELVEPLRARLGRSVESADGDNAELSTMVRAVYREWKNQRIDEHLDELVRTAFGRGSLDVLAAGTTICWAVDPSGPASADCEDNALAGAVVAGEPFPTGHLTVPAHPGCRCMIVLASADH